MSDMKDMTVSATARTCSTRCLCHCLSRSLSLPVLRALSGRAAWPLLPLAAGGLGSSPAALRQLPEGGTGPGAPARGWGGRSEQGRARAVPPPPIAGRSRIGTARPPTSGLAQLRVLGAAQLSRGPAPPPPTSRSPLDCAATRSESPRVGRPSAASPVTVSRRRQSRHRGVAGQGIEASSVTASRRRRSRHRGVAGHGIEASSVTASRRRLSRHRGVVPPLLQAAADPGDFIGDFGPIHGRRSRARRGSGWRPLCPARRARWYRPGAVVTVTVRPLSE